MQFYEEACLLEQKYVQDDSQTVKVGSTGYRAFLHTPWLPAHGPCSLRLMSVVLSGLWRNCCWLPACCKNKHPCCALSGLLGPYSPTSMQCQLYDKT